ncbi:E3 ubiquitin-protein ligase RNF168 [Hyalella azteca]|uniref:E3 ubiquitin-protein ligase RNF182 n=1 Tax=Hyalella azteca TaxID=294128 RepID=A0A8B7PMW2_HYAAZ|nr:E3 ubiquitin-protein ligase RNF168 [Hyalella azteca]
MDKMYACTICYEFYNGCNRKPLSLPCGHVYCHPCLSKIVEKSPRICPSCRKFWAEEIKDLRVIYMLINGEQEPGLSSQEAGEQESGLSSQEAGEQESGLSSQEAGEQESGLSSQEAGEQESGLSSQEAGEQESGLSSQEAGEQESGLSSQEAGEQESGLSSQEAGEQESGLSSQEAGEQESGLSSQEAGEQESGLSSQEAGEQESGLSSQEAGEQESGLSSQEAGEQESGLSSQEAGEQESGLSSQEAGEQESGLSSQEAGEQESGLSSQEAGEQESGLSSQEAGEQESGLSSQEAGEQEFNFTIQEFDDQELYDTEEDPWQIKGENEAQEALADLEIHNSPSFIAGRVATVTSSTEMPILCLSTLLIKLAEAGFTMYLNLDDSFFSRELPPMDCERLDPFLQAGHGHKLVGFYGHVSAATLQKMTGLIVLCLRLETAADVEAHYWREELTDVAVSRNLKPEDIQHRPVSCDQIQCVELEDSEVPWLMALAVKLFALEPPYWRSEKVVTLRSCRLTQPGLAQLLDVGIDVLIVDSSELPLAAMQQLHALAVQKNVELKFLTFN